MTPPMRTLTAALTMGLTGLMALSGCTRTHYKEAADREVYGILRDRAGQVPNMPADFTIEAWDTTLEGLPTVQPEAVEEYLGEAGQQEVGAAMLSLEKALELAVIGSREYQGRKERLYLQALSFTEVRQRYTPVFSGTATGTFTAETVDVVKYSGTARLANAAPELVVAMGELSGTPADLLAAYANVVETAMTATGASAPHTDIQQQRSLSGRTNVGVSMLMKGGARVAIGLTSNFFRFVNGDPLVTTSSALFADFEQPLLGTNRRTARETLLQAQRDLLYEVRSFARYRKSFSVDIASDYYRVLQTRDTVRNRYLGYQAFQQSLERSRALAEAGRLTITDLGRQIEEELQSRNSWVTAIQEYEDSLDRFKVKLGLSAEAHIVLDGTELTNLMERGLPPAPDFSDDDAVQVAFAARLDHYTQRDRTDDAFRKVGLAADALMPDVGLTWSGQVESPPGRDTFDELDFSRYTWDAGLNIDLKLNRRPYRNAYREALINYDAARRELDQLGDNIKLDVRQSWRALEQARVTYEIQRRSLAESERRVLHQELLLEVGEGRALDQIDAQNALIAARNRVSDALVNHTIVYLRLWLNMGILYIKEDGQWEEVTTVSVPEELAEA